MWHMAWGMMLIATLVPSLAVAHEMWVLRPDQVLFWNNQPKPSTFTTLQPLTLFIFGVALFINISLISLHHQGGQEFFPGLRRALARVEHWAPFIVRLCCAWALFSSSFAFEPRYGNMFMAFPTLLAPDLLVSSLPVEWQWLRWFQLLIAVMLILGAYVRLAAAGLLVLDTLAWALYGSPAFAYFLSYLGVGLYLLCRGGGLAMLALPVFGVFRRAQAYFQAIPKPRAQFLLRVLAGLNFLYLAVLFKVLQPNLAVAIIVEHQLPVMGVDPEIVVLIMAITEVSLGFLMLFGIVPRLLALILLGAFLFFAINLSHAETLTSHILYYGVAFSFWLSGQGHWARRASGQKAANVLIIGEGQAAISTLHTLRELDPERDRITARLIHRCSVFVEKSLLPDYIAGHVSAGSVQCPVDKQLSAAESIEGKVMALDPVKHTLRIQRADGSEQTLPYNQLIDLSPETAGTPAPRPFRVKGALMSLNTLIDATLIKQHLRQAIKHQAHTDSPSTSALASGTQASPPSALACVVGEGELVYALAIAIRQLSQAVHTAEQQHSSSTQPIYVIETPTIGLSKRQAQAREKRLAHHAIQTLLAHEVAELSNEKIRLSNGQTLPVCCVIDTDERLQTALNTQPSDSIQRSLPTPGVFNRLYQSQHLAEQLAFNAWARSQKLPEKRLRYQAPYLHDYFLGADSLVYKLGFYWPKPLSSLLTQWRLLGALPSLEQRIRWCFDRLASQLFGRDAGAGAASPKAEASDTQSLAKLRAQRRTHTQRAA